MVLEMLNLGLSRTVSSWLQLNMQTGSMWHCISRTSVELRTLAHLRIELPPWHLVHGDMSYDVY